MCENNLFSNNITIAVIDIMEQIGSSKLYLGHKDSQYKLYLNNNGNMEPVITRSGLHKDYTSIATIMILNHYLDMLDDEIITIDGIVYGAHKLSDVALKWMQDESMKNIQQDKLKYAVLKNESQTDFVIATVLAGDDDSYVVSIDEIDNYEDFGIKHYADFCWSEVSEDRIVALYDEGVDLNAIQKRIDVMKENIEAETKVKYTKTKALKTQINRVKRRYREAKNLIVSEFAKGDN